MPLNARLNKVQAIRDSKDINNMKFCSAIHRKPIVKELTGLIPLVGDQVVRSLLRLDTGGDHRLQVFRVLDGNTNEIILLLAHLSSAIQILQPFALDLRLLVVASDALQSSVESLSLIHI